MFDLKFDLIKINSEESINDDIFDFQNIDENRIYAWDSIMEPNRFPSFDYSIENIDEINDIRFCYKSVLNFQSKKSSTQLASIYNEKINVPPKSIDFDFQRNHSELRADVGAKTTAQNLEENSDFNIDIPKVECIEKVVEELTKTKRIPNVDDVSSFKSLKEIAEIKCCKELNKQKRFGRKDDRDLFARLRQLCNERCKDITDFWNTEPVDKCLYGILSEALICTNYKGSVYDILKRIRKLGEKQEFSVREKILLRKLTCMQLESGKNCYKPYRVLLSRQNSRYNKEGSRQNAMIHLTL